MASSVKKRNADRVMATIVRNLETEKQPFSYRIKKALRKEGVPKELGELEHLPWIIDVRTVPSPDDKRYIYAAWQACPNVDTLELVTELARILCMDRAVVMGEIWKNQPNETLEQLGLLPYCTKTLPPPLMVMRRLKTLIEKLIQEKDMLTSALLYRLIPEEKEDLLRRCRRRNRNKRELSRMELWADVMLIRLIICHLGGFDLPRIRKLGNFNRASVFDAMRLYPWSLSDLDITDTLDEIAFIMK